jgi:hypothetical protein
MKKIVCLALGLLALNLTPVFGQSAPMPPKPIAPAGAPQLPPPPSDNFQQRLQQVLGGANLPANQPPALTKFNLDFPGGTPAQLVKAIEKAMGKPLNAIIPTEDADTQLPPLKMNDVTTPRLFAALAAASRKTVAVSAGSYPGSYSQSTTGYGFNTSDNPVTDTTIWYFRVEKPILPPVVSTAKICQFYSLSRYLDRGFTVDDITTAIQTGWKMSGVNPLPELNYHKETKLLIAYGEPNNLNIIQSVLVSLPSSNATRDELDRLNSAIGQLTDQVGQLKKKIPSPTPPLGSTEEKSGK